VSGGKSTMATAKTPAAATLDEEITKRHGEHKTPRKPLIHLILFFSVYYAPSIFTQQSEIKATQFTFPSSKTLWTRFLCVDINTDCRVTSEFTGLRGFIAQRYHSWAGFRGELNKIAFTLGHVGRLESDFSAAS
jgi:hypothetical protein